MKHWTRIERRWCQDLLEAMVPGLEELDLAAFWDRFDRVAPPMLRVGLRSSVWALTWLPVPMLRTARHFSRLSPEQRDRFLERANESRAYLLRQLVTTVKVTACFAVMEDQRCRSV